MKARKYIGIIAAILACFMSLVACKPQNPGGGTQTTKKPTEGDVCIDLVITKQPNKLEYKTGEKFKPSGLVFDAVYENGFDEDKNLTGGDLDGWLPNGPLTEDDKKIKLIFEGCEKEIDIKVSPKTLLGVEITREPDIKSYSLGDTLDLSGLIVKADYEEGAVENELGYTVTDKDGNVYNNGDVLDKANGRLELSVNVTSGTVTKSDTFVIAVYSGLSVQAEDYVAADAEKPTDKSYTVITGKKVSEVIKKDQTFTGTGYLGSIDKGVVVEFYIYSEYEVFNADLVLIASSTCQGNGKMEDMQVNQLFKVSIGEDDQQVYIDDGTVIEGKPFPEAGSGGSKWTNWADVPLGKINIVPGFNKVTVECIGAIKDTSNYPRTPNIDRLDIREGDGSGEVTQGDWCTDIDIKTMPKTAYIEGQTFDPAGIVFDAVYRNGYDGDTGLGAERITFAPNAPLTTDDTEVTVKFKNFEKKITVTVSPKHPESTEIVREPNVTVFSKGGKLDLNGMIVKVVYDNGITDDNATNYTVTDASGKTYTDGMTLDGDGEITLTVSVTADGVTKSDTFVIVVYSAITVAAGATTESTDSSYTKTTGVTNKGTQNGLNNVVDSFTPGESKIEFYMYAPTAIPCADIVFTMASTNAVPGATVRGDMQFNRMFKVTVGDGEQARELFIGDGVVLKGKDNSWWGWSEVTVGQMQIAQGFNKITLECIGKIVGGDGSTRVANVGALSVRNSASESILGKTLESVSIAHMPDTLKYFGKYKFSTAGLVVNAVYGDVTVANTPHYVIKDGEGNRVYNGDEYVSQTGERELFVEVTDGTVTKRAPLTIDTGSKFSVEAEAQVLSGDTPPENASYTIITGTCAVKTSNVGNSSGGAAVDSMAVGAAIEFHVYSEREVKGAMLVLSASSLNRDTKLNLTKDVKFNSIFKLTIDGKEITIGDDVKIAGRKLGSGDSIWFLMTDNTLCSFDLNEGYTVIKLECKGKVKDDQDGSQRSSNVDKIDIWY